jgi:hypothetical protein
MIETDPNAAIAIIKAAKRALSAHPEGFDEPPFRTWFLQIGAMKFFSRPPPASASIEEIAERLVKEFGKWRKVLNGR